MFKNKFHKDFTKTELKKGLAYMNMELRHAPDWIKNIFSKALIDFEKGKFSYDGATFVRERNNYTSFEVAAFIHDWLNSMGIVSYEVDTLMLRIMLILGYDWKLILWRYLWTRLTFINVLRHKINGTYKGRFAIEIIL